MIPVAVRVAVATALAITAAVAAGTDYLALTIVAAALAFLWFAWAIIEGTPAKDEVEE